MASERVQRQIDRLLDQAEGEKEGQMGFNDFREKRARRGLHYTRWSDNKWMDGISDGEERELNGNGAYRVAMVTNPINGS